MNETNYSKFKKRAAALAVASSLSLTPWIAQAAGLGKITILSGLGQPLRAELDVSASTDELSGMTARLAPPDVFRQAGIDYASVLQDFRFVVEKRPGGQTIVKVSSVKPVNEPFLDFLVELNWPAGRLVREYTFLLDPPDEAVKQVPRAPAPANARVVDTVQGGGAQPVPTTMVPRSTAQPQVAASKELPKEAASDQTRVVKPGETLRKIASEMQHEGVSLEQMLVGLFRQNPEAFSGKNMNRLKSGAILGLPDKETVAAIPEGEAKRVLNTQAADWSTYRQKLAATAAAAPADEAAGGQASSGQITARVQEKAVPAEQPKDQIKVARTDVATPAAAAGKASADAEVDRIARDKALKESQERLAMLEKNVTELQKLLELKNQQLADLQQAARKEVAKPVAEPAKAVEQPKPAEPPSVVEPPKAAEELAVKPAEPAPMPEAAKVPEDVAPVTPSPVEPPKAKTPPPPPPPPPAPEPDLLDSIFGDPLPLVGGAGILALLAGYFFYRRRRANGAALETTTAPAASSLGPNSVFRMTGGQSVDTGNVPPQTGDFSQTGPGTIDTDEVDPVAEADVYMAYGRDTQAEEILLEALQKDPQRLAIHAKLLEIYANRRSVKQFETLASELYAQTGGVGPEWEKVAVLGVGLDPQNPLYSGATPKTPAFDTNAMRVAAPADTGRTTVTMAAGALAQMAAVSAAAKPVAMEGGKERDTLVLGQSLIEETMPEEPADLDSLDFDLGVPEARLTESAGAVAEVPQPVPVTPAFEQSPAAADDDMALDFDISGNVPSAATTTTVGDLRAPARDAAEAVPSVAARAVVQPETNDGGGHDFSADGTLLMPLPREGGIELHMEAAASTFVGGENKEKAKEGAAAEQLATTQPVADFALDLDAAATDTFVNSVQGGLGVATQINNLAGELGDATVIAPLSFDSQAGRGDQRLVETLLSPVADADGVEFDVSLTDSVFLGEPMTSAEFDIGSINLDLAAQPTPAAGTAPVSAGVAPATGPAHDAQWEEVNTKLDLAKAYEEMGDLEGARELLQEVLGEGTPDLIDQAKAILARVGE